MIVKRNRVFLFALSISYQYQHRPALSLMQLANSVEVLPVANLRRRYVASLTDVFCICVCTYYVPVVYSYAARLNFS